MFLLLYFVFVVVVAIAVFVVVNLFEVVVVVAVFEVAHPLCESVWDVALMVAFVFEHAVVYKLCSLRGGCFLIDEFVGCGLSCFCCR